MKTKNNLLHLPILVEQDEDPIHCKLPRFLKDAILMAKL